MKYKLPETEWKLYKPADGYESEWHSLMHGYTEDDVLQAYQCGVEDLKLLKSELKIVDAMYVQADNDREDLGVDNKKLRDALIHIQQVACSESPEQYICTEALK
jgi:hypothetical protein